MFKGEIEGLVNNNALWMMEGKGEGFQDLGRDGRRGNMCKVRFYRERKSSETLIIF